MSAARLSKCLPVKSRCLWIPTVTKPSRAPTRLYWCPATSLSPATATWSSPTRCCSECRAPAGGKPTAWSTARPTRTSVGSPGQERVCSAQLSSALVRLTLSVSVFLWPDVTDTPSRKKRSSSHRDEGETTETYVAQMTVFDKNR